MGENVSLEFFSITEFNIIINLSIHTLKKIYSGFNKIFSPMLSNKFLIFKIFIIFIVFYMKTNI